MGMKEAADRLGKIIVNLAGSTHPKDEAELKALHDMMLGGTGGATANRKKAKPSTAKAPRATKPLKPERVAKATGGKKAKGK